MNKYVCTKPVRYKMCPREIYFFTIKLEVLYKLPAVTVYLNCSNEIFHLNSQYVKWLAMGRSGMENIDWIPR